MDTSLKRPRATRNKNPISPFQRIHHVKGLAYIRNVYENALEKGVTYDKTVRLADLKSIQTLDLRPITPATTDIVISCKVLSLQNAEASYSTHKVRLDSDADMDALINEFGASQKDFDQSSVPLDLHRLSALDYANWDLSALDNDAIHRCHTKGCFQRGHVYFGVKKDNKSTDFCPLWILVNGCLVNCCHHSPPCLYPGL